MSRAFNGSSDYLSLASALTATRPFTVACWFKKDNITTDGDLFDLAAGTAINNYWSLCAATGQTGDYLWWTARNTTARIAKSPNAISSGVWQHACAGEVSASSRWVKLNGGTKGTNGNSSTPVPTNTSIGRFSGSTPSSYFGGQIAELAVWSVELTEAEANALASGVHPLSIRRSSIILYLPIFGINSPELDLSGAATNFAVNGTPAAAGHAPIGRNHWRRRTFFVTKLPDVQIATPGAAIASASVGTPTISGALTKALAQAIASGVASDPTATNQEQQTTATPNASAASAVAGGHSSAWVLSKSPSAAIAASVAGGHAISQSLTKSLSAAAGAAIAGGHSLDQALTESPVAAAGSAVAQLAAATWTFTKSPAQAVAAATVGPFTAQNEAAGGQTAHPAAAIGAAVAGGQTILLSLSKVPNAAAALAAVGACTTLGLKVVSVLSAVGTGIVSAFTIQQDAAGQIATPSSAVGAAAAGGHAISALFTALADAAAAAGVATPPTFIVDQTAAPASAAALAQVAAFVVSFSQILELLQAIQLEYSAIAQMDAEYTKATGLQEVFS